MGSQQALAFGQSGAGLQSAGSATIEMLHQQPPKQESLPTVKEQEEGGRPQISSDTMAMELGAEIAKAADG